MCVVCMMCSVCIMCVMCGVCLAHVRCDECMCGVWWDVCVRVCVCIYISGRGLTAFLNTQMTKSSSFNPSAQVGTWHMGTRVIFRLI